MGLIFWLCGFFSLSITIQWKGIGVLLSSGILHCLTFHARINVQAILQQQKHILHVLDL